MTNESQKPVTEQYRDNWDSIFDKNLKELEPIPFAGMIDLKLSKEEKAIFFRKTLEL